MMQNQRRRVPPGTGLGQMQPQPPMQTPQQAAPPAAPPFKPEHSVGELYRGGRPPPEDPGAVAPQAVKHAPNLFGSGPKSLSPEVEARLKEIAARTVRTAGAYKGPAGLGLAQMQRKLTG